MPQYIKNKELYAEVVECKKTGQISDKLATAFLQLANKYSNKPNFAGYSYVDEMRSEALVTLCQNWDKFDHERFENAFAYYTQIVHNTFVLYLKREKKQRNIRDAILTEAGKPASWNYEDDQRRKVQDELSVSLAEEQSTEKLHR